MIPEIPTRSTRRQWLGKSACAVAAVAAARALSTPARAHAAAPVHVCLPKRVAGIRIPDSKLARAAAGLAQSVSPETLYNHCLRTYVFAALLYKQRGVKFDEELTFVASALHDLGLVDQFMTPHENFPIDGADAAHAFLQSYDVTDQFRETVWDAIAVHGFAGYATRKAPEIAAIALGAGMDVTGQGLEELPAEEVAGVLAALPRLDFKRQSIATILHVCETKPLGVALTPLAEVGRAHLPGFAVPTLEDLFLAAPFEE
jgi:hypothetical protein